jgi:hypothetical protein
MRHVSRNLILAGLFAVAPLSSHAAEPRAHDGGFFLRLAAGGGTSNSKIEEGGDDIELRGTSGSFDVAVGAVLARNLAVHATLGGFGLVDPTVEFNGREESTDDVTLTMSMVGGGVTYYFGDSNTYVTASAGAGRLTFEFDGDSEDSDTGLAVDVGIGKEWWVSDRWGIGVSGTVGFHDIPPGDADSNFKGRSVAVRFSATFN